MLGVIDVLIANQRALETMLTVLAVSTWLAVSFAVGAIAQGKGHSSAYTLLAIFLSPLIGALVALSLSDRRAADIAKLQNRLAKLEGQAQFIAPNEQLEHASQPLPLQAPPPKISPVRYGFVWLFVVGFVLVVAFLISVQPARP